MDLVRLKRQFRERTVAKIYHALVQGHPDPTSGTVYVPDTSALIENPDALDRLLTGGNLVVLLHQVVEELGRLQSSRTKSEGVRHAARLVSRKLLEYRRHQLIHHGVEALLAHEVEPEAYKRTPTGGLLATDNPDDHEKFMNQTASRRTPRIRRNPATTSSSRAPTGSRSSPSPTAVPPTRSW